MRKTPSRITLLTLLIVWLAPISEFCPTGFCQTDDQVASSNAATATDSAATKPTSSANAKNKTATVEVNIDGLVTGLKKYSMTIQSGDKTYTVKLANGAPIGMRMNQPWFDWKNNRVVVDALRYPNDPNAKSAKRVAMKLPAEKLFLISRFTDVEHMTKIMATNVKRINYYLITPEDLGAHLPTAAEPYISGELVIQKNGQPRLQIEEQLMPIRLGFKTATMNGFSITALKPEKTQVFLSAVEGPNENELIATRILFQPVVKK